MKNFVTLCFVSLAITGSAENKGSAWIELFDGESLAGWTPNFNDQQVEVTDGVIQILSVKKNLWLVHELSLIHI